MLSLAEQENLFAIIRALTAPDRRSSTSRTGSRRSSPSPTASPCSATAGRRGHARARGGDTGGAGRLMVGHEVERPAPPGAARRRALLRRAPGRGASSAARAGEIVGRRPRRLGPVAAGADAGRPLADGAHRGRRAGALPIARRRARPRHRVPHRGPDARGALPGPVRLANTSAAALRGLSPGGARTAGRERRAAPRSSTALRGARSLRRRVRALSAEPAEGHVRPGAPLPAARPHLRRAHPRRRRRRPERSMASAGSPRRRRGRADLVGARRRSPRSATACS